MTQRHPMFGLALAASGALIMTPDTLFMRWTGMDGWAMLGWRGLSAGAVFLLAWILVSRGRIGPDLRALLRRPGLTVIAAQTVNATLFSFAVAAAPVAVVLFAVATMPVFAAILGRAITGERTGPAAWLTTAAVLAGIGLAVFGRDAGGVGLNGASLIGALGGLGVAAAMALSFTTIRRAPGLPVLPALGLGSLIAGLGATTVTGVSALAEGQVWAALVSGVVILPASFAALNFATRHTAAVNVSLLLLLETILAPVCVWIGAGEPMGGAEIAGGLIVIVSLALYIRHGGRQERATAAG